MLTISNTTTTSPFPFAEHLSCACYLETEPHRSKFNGHEGSVHCYAYKPRATSVNRPILVLTVIPVKISGQAKFPNPSLAIPGCKFADTKYPVTTTSTLASGLAEKILPAARLLASLKPSQNKNTWVASPCFSTFERLAALICHTRRASAISLTCQI